MAQKILSKEEIAALSQTIKENFKALNTQRDTNPLAHHIQFPKIPSILSESIINHLLTEKKLLPELTIEEILIDHSQADIVVRTSEGNKNIEVKSTGKSAFQNFGVKDIRADYILWLHFDTFFNDTTSETFEIFIIKDPKRYFEKPLKITLAQMKTMVPDSEIKIFKMTEL